ncbi:MAG TPA: bacterioferritin [Rhizomicrobium sp.]|jgi:bacterioferritin
MPGNDRRNAGRSRAADAHERGGVEPAPGPKPRASLSGDPDIIRALNAVLKNELTAINQYFLHSRMLADWGLSTLAKQEYEESVDEMRHADRLIRRILFLGGLPNLQDLGKLRIGEDLADVLGCDLKLEQQSLPELHQAVALCERTGDYVSRELFVHILKSEEEHIDWLQTQFRLIEQMGLANFAQLQTKPNESGVS